MEKKKKVTIKQEQTVDIICDCCGESCKIKNKNNLSAFEFMKLDATWGYFSNKDTEQWTAHICEKCVDEKLSFIKFQKTNYL